MVLNDPVGPHDDWRPHPRDGADLLGAFAVREFDDDLPVGRLHVHVRRCVLPRRQEDDDSEPDDAKNRGHNGTITQPMGFGNSPVERADIVERFRNGALPGGGGRQRGLHTFRLDFFHGP